MAVSDAEASDFVKACILQRLKSVGHASNTSITDLDFDCSELATEFTILHRPQCRQPTKTKARNIDDHHYHQTRKAT